MRKVLVVFAFVFLIVGCAVSSKVSVIKILDEETLLRNLADTPDNQINIGLYSLSIAKGFYPNIDIAKYLKKLDTMASELKEKFKAIQSPEQKLFILNSYINQHRVKNTTFFHTQPNYIELITKGNFLNEVLDKTAGNCMGYTTLYLALAERLGIPLYPVILPYHIYIQYDDGTSRFEIETTIGSKFSIRDFKLSAKQYNLAITDKMISEEQKRLTRKEMVIEMLNNRGGTKDDKGDFDGAIKDFTKVIEFKPDFAQAYNNRGATKGKKGDFYGAIKDHTKSIELNPDYPDPYYNRGIAKADKGDIDGALKDYNKAIELNPNFAQAYADRGIAKYKIGDFNGAIKDYSKAIKLNPKDAQAYNNRGAAKYANTDHNGAILDWEKAIQLNPAYEQKLKLWIEKAKKEGK